MADDADHDLAISKQQSEWDVFDVCSAAAALIANGRFLADSDSDY